MLCQANQTKEKSPLLGELGEAPCQPASWGCVPSVPALPTIPSNMPNAPRLHSAGPIGLTVGKDVNKVRRRRCCSSRCPLPYAPRVPLRCRPIALSHLVCIAVLTHLPPGVVQEEAAAPAESKAKKGREGAAQAAGSLMDKAGVSLGPIGLTIGSELKSMSLDEEDGAGPSGSGEQLKSYASLSTEEWRELYEKDGCVDLWVQEEFNSGSRLVVSSGGVGGCGGGGAGARRPGPMQRAPPLPACWAPGQSSASRVCMRPGARLLWSKRRKEACFGPAWRAPRAGERHACACACGCPKPRTLHPQRYRANPPAHPHTHTSHTLSWPCRVQGGSAVYRGGTAGYLSGEGPGVEGATRHKVKIINHYLEEEFEVEVPEDRCAGVGEGGARGARADAGGDGQPVALCSCRASANAGGEQLGAARYLPCSSSCWPGQNVSCLTCPPACLRICRPAPPAALPLTSTRPPPRRYVLFAAEEEGYDLPYACRLGCCTACTVKVVEGEMFQPHSLGLSKNLRDEVGGGGGGAGGGCLWGRAGRQSSCLILGD